MAGEGILPSAPSWDQRPGYLEATHDSLPAVAGRRDDDGWKVWLSVLGMAVTLPPLRARQLAQDILDMCDVIEGANDVVAGGEA